MQRQEVLVTGGSGFFGGVLKRRLLAEGFAVTNIDLVRDEDAVSPNLGVPFCCWLTGVGHINDKNNNIRTELE